MSTLAVRPEITASIDRLLEAGSAHALLLTGEMGAGAFEAAERIAKRVLCPDNGCNECAVCQRVSRRVHPDLTWVSPEGMALTIDQTRRVADQVMRAPFEADSQVVVLELADTLSSDNAEAGNALLKALEEPAGSVVFVLLARRAARLLPTIRSRAIEIAFPPMSDTQVYQALTASGVTDASVAPQGLDVGEIARCALGDMSRANAMVAGDDRALRRAQMHGRMLDIIDGRARGAQLAGDMIRFMSARERDAEQLATAEFDAMLERMSKDEQKRFKAKSSDDGIEKRTKRRMRRARIDELVACLDDIASLWRDVMAVGAGANAAIRNVDRLEQLQALAGTPASERAVAALDAIDDITARLTINNGDEAVLLGALCSELAGCARGRVRARRTLGAPARTATGYDLSLG